MNTQVEQKSFVASKSIAINSSPEKVWEALTNPEKIKLYLFGTHTVTDWKVGSPIRFYGEWEGKRYEDKGTIKAVRPFKLIHYTFWSGLAGKEDVAENYHHVTYRLSQDGDRTILTIEQDGVDSEKSKQHSESNWQIVLNGLKSIVEAT